MNFAHRIETFVEDVSLCIHSSTVTMTDSPLFRLVNACPFAYDYMHACIESYHATNDYMSLTWATEWQGWTRLQDFIEANCLEDTRDENCPVELYEQMTETVKLFLQLVANNADLETLSDRDRLRQLRQAPHFLGKGMHAAQATTASSIVSYH